MLRLFLWSSVALSALVIAVSVYYAMSPARDSQVVKLSLMSLLLVPPYIFIMVFFRPAVQLVVDPNTIFLGLMLVVLLTLPFAVILLLARNLLGNGGWLWVVMYLYPITVETWSISKDQISSEVKFIGISYFVCIGLAILISLIPWLSSLDDWSSRIAHYQQLVPFFQNSGDNGTVVYVIAALIFANIIQIKTIINNLLQIFYKT